MERGGGILSRMNSRIEEAAEAVAKQHLLVEAMGNVAHLKADERTAARARYELECAKLDVLRERLRELMRTLGADIDEARKTGLRPQHLGAMSGLASW
jgi:hypothetical protein